MASLRFIARLPAGHYHRTNLAMGPDGSVFVCGGFQIRQIFRISPAGEVSTVASELGDPGGIVFDRAGALYVAETALHRIIRTHRLVRPAAARSHQRDASECRGARRLAYRLFSRGGPSSRELETQPVVEKGPDARRRPKAAGEA